MPAVLSGCVLSPRCALRLALVLALCAFQLRDVSALEPLPAKLVVLTFDDSAKSHAAVVGPLLKKHKFGATFFITEGFDFRDNKRDYMTWDEIKKLHEEGFEIGNHTRDHFVVNANNVDRLREQVEAITLSCREHGIPDPVSFAWPGNGFDVKALPVLRECGIRWARRGGSPEYDYKEGQGPGYQPGQDHPLLIPTTIDARPFSSAFDMMGQIRRVHRNGWIPVIQLHGTPDTAHQWVNFPQAEFEQFVSSLANGNYTVIALRDLEKYVDPEAAPADPMSVIDARRERRRQGKTILHPADGAEMIYVPAGPFIMRLDRDEADLIAKDLDFESADDIAAWASYPKRSIPVDGFFIDRHETTYARWKTFVAATGHKTGSAESAQRMEDPASQSYPVGAVTWDEAKAYAAWAGKSLPTEAQWEKSARGRDGNRYPWGNDPPHLGLARFAKKSEPGRTAAPIGKHPMGMSPFGVFDMLGNQAEWTSDVFEPYPDNPEAAKFPVADGKMRISVRGGSWQAGDRSGYAASRAGYSPDDMLPFLGFRTAWVPPKGYFDSGRFQKDHAAVAQVLQPLTEAERKPVRYERIDIIPSYSQHLAADAQVFQKGIDWAVRYDADTITHADRELIAKARTAAVRRADLLFQGKSPWMDIKGKKVHGYTSKVDGSVQPYGVIIPAKYDPKTPIRLDVVLHGSTKPVGMSELRFMARFDDGDVGAGFVPDVPYIELHPLGRVENCYRWAGETDVFEAIADVCKRYNIDRSRIVLRGMSMGASGTWHLGLKHPSFFAALGPYCGYVDTHRFSETPLPNFLKVGPLPEHQELGLHMLDSVDYAANAAVVPAVACMGEKDIFFDAHVIMGRAFEKEGLKLNNLISPGTGHVVDPVTHAEQLKQIAEHLTKRGRASKGYRKKPGDEPMQVEWTGPVPPQELRFVTWTLKYSRCHWVQFLGLEKHYSRAEIRATVKDRTVEVGTLTNITRFAILPETLGHAIDVIRIDGSEIQAPRPKPEQGIGPPVILVRDGESWKRLESADVKMFAGKRPGVQGPIDDAFTMPFLCVRGTGTPWNPAAHAYADAAIDRFAEEWRHYFRGECPIRKDTDVTEEDVRSKNLILFGDPGSNSWIAKVLPAMPIRWTRETLTMAGTDYASKDHVPALIQPNPLPGAETRYVVFNSGHTFREKDLSRVNYLLFPRWGDWAVLKVGADASREGPFEEVIRAGYFDEEWK